jgi:carotenoid cleavage dioxygenase-like enzyme
MSLYMLFTPITYYLHGKIRCDPSGYATLKGNFAPVSHEHSYQITEIEGKVPTDLQGVYLKNGPNNQFPSRTGRHQWFEGDGMLHAFRLKQG